MVYFIKIIDEYLIFEEIINISFKSLIKKASILSWSILGKLKNITEEIVSSILEGSFRRRTLQRIIGI